MDAIHFESSLLMNDQRYGLSKEIAVSYSSPFLSSLPSGSYFSLIVVYPIILFLIVAVELLELKPFLISIITFSFS
jgi:hypothetical protein